MTEDDLYVVLLIVGAPASVETKLAERLNGLWNKVAHFQFNGQKEGGLARDCSHYIARRGVPVPSARGGVPPRPPHPDPATFASSV